MAKRYWKVKLGLFIADQLADAQDWVRTRWVGQQVWKSANGEVELVSELGDGHLGNIICMLIREKDPQLSKPVFKALVREMHERTAGGGHRKLDRAWRAYGRYSS